MNLGQLNLYSDKINGNRENVPKAKQRRTEVKQNSGEYLIIYDTRAHLAQSMNN